MLVLCGKQLLVDLKMSNTSEQTLYEEDSRIYFLVVGLVGVQHG